MESNTLEQNFALVCKSLLQPLEESQKIIGKATDEIELDFDWLSEIKKEAFKQFAVKRNKYVMMPKTPSQKTRGQRKTKKKLSELNEEKENENLSDLKCVPTKLKFEEDSSDKSDTTDIFSDSNTDKPNRPQRKCRKQKPSYVDEDEKLQQVTRQSRRIQNKSQTARKPEISPCVKDRAKAYEDLIKKRATESPVTTHSTKNGCNDRLTPTTSKDQNSTKVSHIVEPQSTLPAKSRSPTKKTEEKKVNCNSNTNALDETQVMVTEVFEIQSKSATLKESETVKIKTMPLNHIEGKQKLPASTSGAQNTESEFTLPAKPRSLDNKTEGVKMNSNNNNAQAEVSAEHLKPSPQNLDETQVMVTEVFEIECKSKQALLKDSEIVKIKTISLNNFAGNQSCNKNSKEAKSVQGETVIHKNKIEHSFVVPAVIQETNSGPSTRTRTRAMQQKQPSESNTQESNKDLQSNLNATYDKDDEDSFGKSARTRTISKKEPDSFVNMKDEDDSFKKSSRTRTIIMHKDSNSGEETNSKSTRTKTISRKDLDSSDTQSDNDGPSTRTRKAKQATSLAAAAEELKSVLDLNHPRCGLKRPVEERGLSPCPKRTRSYQFDKKMQDETIVVESPVKKEGNSVISKDIVKTPTRKSPRAFKFNSAQKKLSGFTARTPGFGMNTNRLFTFVKSTPQNYSTSQSFLKRNSPSPVLTLQVIQEQKKKKMLEKESRDQERMKRAAELKKRKIEEMKRQREEKERRVAEMKERKLREEQENKERLNKKLEEQSALNEKLMEAKMREEKEKQKLRLKKQLEADARRKQEEEERLCRLAEQERERMRQQEEEKKSLAQAEAKKMELQKLINKHNETLKANTSKVSVNNQTVSQEKSINSYELTPVKDKVYNVANKDPDNYNIEDIGSDDSTDDDEAPKKQIPKWATGMDLNLQLIKQHTHPPDLMTLFRHCCLDPPDLEKVFAGTKKRRYKERTSSAIWN